MPAPGAALAEAAAAAGTCGACACGGGGEEEEEGASDPLDGAALLFSPGTVVQWSSRRLIPEKMATP
jgi:hypothetical protein